MIEYTLMGPEHVSQVAQLETECFSDPWSERSITSELTNPLSCWIVALCDKRVVGYVGSQAVMGEADMMNIAVDPAWRRRGIARSFYDLLMSLFPEQTLLISTRTWSTNNSHISLLEKMGFTGPLRIENDRGPGIDTVYYHFYRKGDSRP